MAKLMNVIAALQREIDDALNTTTGSNSRHRLVPDRIVLKLEVSLSEKKTNNGLTKLQFDVAPADSKATGAHPHTLTIEFKNLVPNSPLAASLPAPVASVETAAADAVQIDGMESDHIIAALSPVFGAPGFDSSARATVFREVFDALDAGQASKLIASFSSAFPAEVNSAVRTAAQRINGILRSGPQRSPEEGRKILARAFHRQTPQLILKLIEQNWKTQEDWLDIPMPATKPVQD